MSNTATNVVQFPKSDTIIVSVPEIVSATVQPQVLIDIENMTKTELRTKYKFTATCHKGMLTRCKFKNGVKSKYTVRPDIYVFIDFLRLVGANPRDFSKTPEIHTYTLDRIDNTDNEYAPHKIRWSTKTEQNNNKSNVDHYSCNGERHTLPEWEKITGVKADTIRKRLNVYGWTLTEALYGKAKSSKLSKGKAESLVIWKTVFPEKNPEQVEEYYKKGRKCIVDHYFEKEYESRQHWLRRVLKKQNKNFEDYFKENYECITGEAKIKYDEFQVQYDRNRSVLERLKKYCFR